MTDEKLPDEKDVARALAYLAETDVEYAKAKAWAVEMEKREKMVIAAKYVDSNLKTQEDRKQHAYASGEYRAWLTDMTDANTEAYLIAARRRREEHVIEVWRSINANRRQGNFN